MSAKWLKLSGLVLVLLTIALAVAGWRYLQFLNTPMDVTESFELNVPKGSNAYLVGKELEQRELIKQPLFYRIMLRHKPELRRIRAGHYRVTAGMTPVELLRKLVEGDVIKHQISLIEGWNFRQVRAALASEKRLIQNTEGLTDAQLMERLGKAGEHPEGRFYPDTYQFIDGTSDLDILANAYQRLEAVLEEEWQNRADNLPYKSPYEALIMASIVEKETGVPSERAEIAGVFVRRLQKNMRLQTDPTVIYGIGKAYDGNIRKVHLRTDTPYNTYTRKGLPPTPIAISGREAIHAALHPAHGEYLYFVSKGDGSHQFSVTLDQHLKAVRKYQLKKK